MRTRLILLILVLVGFFGVGWAFGLQGAPAQPSPITCYPVDNGAINPVPPLGFTNQFIEATFQSNIVSVAMVCTPVEKTLPADKKPKPIKVGDHYTCYELGTHMGGAPHQKKGPDPTVTDQFGKGLEQLSWDRILCEPADKTPVAGGGPRP